MPIANSSPVRSGSAEVHKTIVRAVGGSSAITEVTGPGVAVTRTGTGAYLLTWSDEPGNFLGVTGKSLQATTPGNLAGHTLIPGAYDASAKTMSVSVFNAADAAHDLAALEWFTIELAFSYSNVDL